MKKKHWLLVLAIVLALGAILPSYFRAYRVFGASDAPSFLVGDRIFVNHAAFDIRLPYTDIVIVAHSRPERGDVVMFRAPGQEYSVFKRVIGCPGDTVGMRDNRLEINGTSLRYEPVDARPFRAVAESNKLGAQIEREIGNGAPHLISHTPGASSYASFGPVRVPDDHYFLLGDNRDNSEDSRMYGAVSRRSILGELFGGRE